VSSACVGALLPEMPGLQLQTPRVLPRPASVLACAFPPHFSHDGAHAPLTVLHVQAGCRCLLLALASSSQGGGCLQGQPLRVNCGVNLFSPCQAPLRVCVCVYLNPRSEQQELAALAKILMAAYVHAMHLYQDWLDVV